MENVTERKCHIWEWTPAEIAINAAIQIVENIGADVRLTDAIILLAQAQNKVADFVDNIEVKNEVNGLNYWVAVGERMPIGRVLLLTISKMIVLGDWYKGIWRVDGATYWETRVLCSQYHTDDITHWMKLPEVNF